MASKSKRKPRKKTVRSARKASDSKRGKESEAPNIIEEPIRVIGDETGKKSAKARKPK